MQKKKERFVRRKGDKEGGTKADSLESFFAPCINIGNRPRSVYFTVCMLHPAAVMLSKQASTKAVY